MNPTEIRDRFRRLNVWKRGDQRAPHKPLLLLLALARCRSGVGEPFIRFSEVEEKLTRLLKDFGPARSSYHPELPFWHLHSDGIWRIPRRDEVLPRKGASNPTAAELRRKEISAGFEPGIWETLRGNSRLIRDIAHDLLEVHFPASIHDDILSAVGFDDFEEETVQRQTRKRDPEFRRRILLIYNYTCAICGLDIRLENSPIGVEAAHIKWHQAHGPSTECNGVALCALHHKLFDRGAITIDPNLLVQVSERVHGTVGFEDWVRRFHGQQVKRPSSDIYRPREEFISWHVKEVFQGPVWKAA